MATIDQFGGTTDNLDSPPLGGPTGWAAAVRDSLNTKTVILNGSIPPTSDHGVAGNYYLDTTANILYGPKAAVVTVDNLLTENQASGTDTLGNTTGFTATNATLVSDTGWFKQGARSLQCTTTLASGSAPVVVGGTTSDGTIPVTAGLTYTASAYYRQATPSINALVRVLWWTSAGNVAASTPNMSSATTAMTAPGATLQVTGTAPANAAFASVIFYGTTISAIGQVWNVDEMGFWQGSGGTWAMPGTFGAPTWPVAIGSDGIDPIVFKSSTGAQGASVTPVWPAGIVSGDVAILTHVISNTYPSPSTPSGFTLLDSIVGTGGGNLWARLTVWTKVCTGIETGNVVTFDNASSSYESGSITVYSGVYVVGDHSTEGSGGVTTSLVSDAMTDVVAGDRVVHIVAAENTTPNTVISTSGATTRLSLSGASDLTAMLVADVADSGAPVTFNQTISSSMAIVSLVLKKEVPVPTGTTILEGTSVPTISDGAEGNYYLDKTASVLYGPKSDGSYGAAENILSGTPTASTTDAVNYTLGIKFRALVAGRVNGVRFYRHTASTVTSRSMHLWGPTGTSLATGTTSSETGAGWFTVTFGTPVNLTAGTIYTASFNNPTSMQYYALNTTVPVTSNSHFDSLEGKYAMSTSTWPTLDDGPPGYNFYVDIIFQPDPDVWPIALRGTPTAFAVGTVSPTSPSLNDIWVDTN